MEQEIKTTIKPIEGAKRIRLLDVGIDPVTRKELRKILKSYLKDELQHFVATVNPEFIIEASKNKTFKDILGYSDLNTADGVGILWAARFLDIPVNTSWVQSRGRRVLVRKILTLWQAFYSLLAIILFPPYLRKPIPQRITGTDLAEILIDLTQSGNYSAYIIGGTPASAAQAKLELEKQFPKGVFGGCRSGFLKEGETEEDLYKAVNKARPDILLVAMGSPKQEEWIFKNMDSMPTVQVAVGIGGAIDFFSKKKKRAPQWMRKKGLEWVFRFYLEPKRLPRIKNATFIFIKKIVKFKMQDW